MVKRSTWIMLGVFGLLLVFVLMWNRVRPEAGGTGEATPSPEPFWKLTSDQIEGVRVEDSVSGEVVEAQRDQETLWRIVEPADGRLDIPRIERAASWLSSPQPRAVLPAIEDLTPFGLKEPSMRVTVYLKDGSSRGFSIGREAPTGGSSYVLVAGQPEVFIVNKAGLEEVLGLLDDLLPATPTSTVEPTPTPTATAGATTETAAPAPVTTRTPSPAATP